ncbi:hypothetical protein LUD75_08065 [Epilithonimonas sp. JDS]|uniref:hypothetical protein n=1 Tax=Epilithonimonas sp. JDS TaxID=2902797 RepID=UPI001E2BD95F|nr:hypothetical protein [Epilithonimonas sp. JDS]MCD9854659.1 hypothetical protein [Epilithonimonas sp. JDS]
MKQNFQILFSVIFLTFFLRGNSQETEVRKNGEIILNKKIEKYKSIDSLDKNYPLNVINHKQRILDFEVTISEGTIKIENLEKKIFGDGGFSVYNFIDTKTKKNLKMEYGSTTHIYKDKNLKEYRNSEIRKITVFFDDNSNADLVKITENQYNNEEVLSSTLYYLNMPQTRDYFQNTETKSLIDEIFQIIKYYKK